MSDRGVLKHGPFTIDQQQRLVSKAGVDLALSPKAYEVLVVLAENAGKRVGKDELMKRVWAGTHVGEAVIHRAVSDLRKVLQDGDGTNWIETIPKFGYRLTPPREPVREPGAEPPAAPEAALRRARWPAWIGAAVLLSGIMLVSFKAMHGIPQRPQRLAVLPFQLISPHADQEAIGLGLADDIIVRLSGRSNLSVASVALVRRYSGSNTDPIQAGQDLHADVVVDGSLQSHAGNWRANARLLRVSDGSVLWSGSATARAGDLPGLEDQLVRALMTALSLGTQGISRAPDPEAHNLYVNGRYQWGKRTPEGFDLAAQLFRRAIDIDPSFARAYAGLADCYMLMGGYGVEPQLEMLPKAKAMGLRALKLDPKLAEAHATLAWVVQNLEWDWPGAESHYRRALDLDPNYATARHWHAEFLSILGRFDESRREFRLARSADPVSPIIAVDEAQLDLFERKFDAGTFLLENLLRSEPRFAPAWERLSWILLAKGDENRALSAAFKGDCGPACRTMWTAWLPSRDPQGSRRALAELEKSPATPLYALAVAYGRHGDVERGMDVLERMANEHAVWLITAKVNPLFDPLRRSPRYQALLRRLRLI